MQPVHWTYEGQQPYALRQLDWEKYLGKCETALNKTETFWRLQRVERGPGWERKQQRVKRRIRKQPNGNLGVKYSELWAVVSSKGAVESTGKDLLVINELETWDCLGRRTELKSWRRRQRDPATGGLQYEAALLEGASESSMATALFNKWGNWAKRGHSHPGR